MVTEFWKAKRIVWVSFGCRFAHYLPIKNNLANRSDVSIWYQPPKICSHDWQCWSADRSNQNLLVVLWAYCEETDEFFVRDKKGLDISLITVVR